MYAGQSRFFVGMAEAPGGSDRIKEILPASLSEAGSSRLISGRTGGRDEEAEESLRFSSCKNALQRIFLTKLNAAVRQQGKR